MQKLVILLKTFVDDLKYVERLIPTYNKHNKDNIPLYFVVPEGDIKVESFGNPQAKPPGKTTKDLGEYVDYEEVK